MRGRRRLLPSRRRTRDSRKKNQESVLKRFISKVQEGTEERAVTIQKKTKRLSWTPNQIYTFF